MAAGVLDHAYPSEPPPRGRPSQERPPAASHLRGRWLSRAFAAVAASRLRHAPGLRHVVGHCGRSRGAYCRARVRRGDGDRARRAAVRGPALARTAVAARAPAPPRDDGRVRGRVRRLHGVAHYGDDRGAGRARAAVRPPRLPVRVRAVALRVRGGQRRLSARSPRGAPRAGRERARRAGRASGARPRSSGVCSARSSATCASSSSRTSSSTR